MATSRAAILIVQDFEILKWATVFDHYNCSFISPFLCSEREQEKIIPQGEMPLKKKLKL